MKKLWSFICALFLGLSCLVGCGKGSTNFQLKFMVDDSVYATVSTSGSEVIQMPKDPVKEDYTFEGWYWDKDVWRNQFTARSLVDTPLSSNMEVYAHFVDESDLHGTEINIKSAEKVNIEGIGDVFYLRVRNNQLVCKFNDYVEINPHSSWILSTDLAGNNPITTKTVELIVGDNPLYYIYVTDKDERHETYIVLVHRNYMYTVSFNSNGGTPCSSQQVEEGYYLENIPTTTRKGYTFDRWNYDFKNEPIKSNITAKAIWTANNYKITYNPNGGSISSETQIVTFDEHYSLLTPSRLGYTFKGWKTSSGSYFANSGTWNLDQDISLTAEWEIVYYSITYELNGGSSSGIVLKSSYTVEDSFTIPSPTRNGYTFKGWSLFSSLSDAEIDYSVSKGTTGNLKFYAKWQANSYTVTYDVNGGDALEENTQTVTYGENTTLANPSREGFDFAGWYNGSSKVSDGDWNIANDVTLTAKWEAIEYAIKYNLNGGTNSSNNPLKYTAESETIVLEDATREGYTFKGWTTDEIVEPTVGLTVPHGSTGEKQFTANWDANTYTVTYDVNGGNAIEDNVKEYVFDSDVTLLTPTRPGYNFAGWYYGTQLVDSGIWKIAENVTLVARWSREEFNIQYQLNNGNNDPSNPTSYNYDSETITLADATRVGYTFLGWTSSEIQAPTKGAQIVHNSVGDKLFIANWQANTYTVTYYVNGGNSIGKKSEEIVFDEVLTLINPTRTGYTFSGWYSGNTLYESGVWKTAKNVTLVARWTPNNYTITKENGSGAGSSTVTYDDSYNLGTSSKYGYDFVGWYTEMYGQGTQYTDASGSSLNPYTDANDQTLYASFVYHITFVTNGGSYVPPLTLHENECLSDTIVSEKENRTFAGWFTDAKLTQPVSYSQPLGNITLYAKWEEEVQPTQLTYAHVSSTQLTIKGMSYSGSSVILPSHIGGEPVKAIDEQAFKSMSFSSIEIPQTVTNIGYSAFQGCSSLVNLTVPFIGKTTSATIYEGVLGYIFGRESYSGGTETQNYPGYGSSGYYYIPTSLKNITITSQTSISSYAFYNCSNIQSITIPQDVKSIGGFAFSGCTSLKRLNSDVDGVFNIPSGVTVIKSNTFENCTQAKEINISNSVTSIGDYAFNGCTGVTKFNSSQEGSLIVPTSCQSIGQYAFRGMSFISDVVVSNSTTSIGYASFSGFSSLVNLTVPFIGKTTSATIYEGVLGYIFGRESYSGGTETQNYPGYGSSGYYYIPTSLKNITITSQTSISSYAFYNCSNIERINYTKYQYIYDISAFAFANCSSLLYLNSNYEGEFNISSSTKTFGDSAFEGCVNCLRLNSNSDFTLNIPENCQTIGSYAFEGLVLIKTIVVPNSVTNIGYAAFSGFSSLVNLTVPFIGKTTSATIYEGVLGYIFGRESYSGGTETQNYPGYGSSGYYYIPKTLKNLTVTNQTSISNYAFYNCSNLQSITIPQDVKSIGSFAFSGCTSLKRLNSDVDGVFNIPSRVTVINSNTFENCTQAKEINISNSVTSIGDYAFNGCTGVTKFNSSQEGSLIVPTSCQSIGQYAFRGMSFISDVVVSNSTTSIGYASFSGFSSLVNLTVPFIGKTTSATIYEGVLGYIFGRESYSGGTETQNYPGYGSSGYYYIPTSLRTVIVTTQTSLPNYAFYNCNNLETINLLKDADTSASYCLSNCSATVNKVLDEAPDTPWNGTSVSEGFSAGSGTINDPYVINSAADLAYLAQQVNSGNSFAGVYFVLGNSINLNGHSLIIGDSSSHPFCGTINGNGNVIQNLSINSSSVYVGLFGYFNGTIYNMGFDNVSITSNTSEDYVYTGIFGYVGSDAIIHDVYSTGTIKASGQSYCYAGGLVGYCEGTIYNSYSRCNVSSTSIGYIAYAGGLVGYLNNGSITNCFVTGNVSAKGATTNYSRNGGLVGSNSSGTIENCYKSSSQTLTRNGTKDSSYNEEGTAVSFDGVTGDIIIETFGWDSNIWDGSEDFPLLIKQ